MVALRQAIESQQSGLRHNDFPESGLNTWIGRVSEIDNQSLGSWQSRNNALSEIGLRLGTLEQSIEQIKQQYSPARVGIVMGSSTSSIDRTETAYADLDADKAIKQQYQQPQVHNPHAPSLFVADLDLGLIDAALVGGVDTLCLSVLHGFHSLQLVSEQPCRPFDAERDGINLGEAAGFAVLVRADSTTTGHPLLTGYGESSDAHHMSAPHPQGLGAKMAMQQALQLAGLSPEDIDYINLHGTASQANDTVEGTLVSTMFPASTLCSSTKGWTGHTLGAAGITEALIALDAFQTDTIPGNLNLSRLESGLKLSISSDNRKRAVSHVMSNSFGFGGNNCSLVFSRG